jgi:glutathione peroxidase
MSLYDIEVQSIDGQALKLDAYKGSVLLIVNVASKCMFTTQYAGLEDLYRRYKDKGLVVLGFPCNQFGAQEPKDEAAIKSFCSLKYDVSFPMFKKIDVNGTGAHPLYAHLKAARPGLFGTTKIKWNFTKFLVDRAGKVVKRYGPMATPRQIEQDLTELLGPVS